MGNREPAYSDTNPDGNRKKIGDEDEGRRKTEQIEEHVS